MAYLDASGIRSAMRSVIDDNGGSQRKISEGRFTGNYWFGSGDAAGRVRSLSATRYDIPPFTVQNTHATPLIGSHQILRIEPSVVCEYSLEFPADSDSNRDATIAVAEQDGDQIQQALEINMGGATATSVIGGSWLYDGSEIVEEDYDSRRLIVRHTFTALVVIDRSA